MKVQVLYFSKAGNATTIGDGIARHLKCKQDAIPPAYPAENEKIVFVGIDYAGKTDKKLMDFCRTLTPARTANVAFFVVSKNGTADISAYKEAIASSGVNVIDEVYNCKGKFLFSGKGKPDANDVSAAIAWADKVIDSISQK